MDPTFSAWLALIAGLVALLLIDLFVLHRGAHAIPMRNAAWSTAAFASVGLLFGVALGVLEGPEVGQYFAGYLLALSLSLDNVSVWAVIFGAFSVPADYQQLLARNGGVRWY